MELLNVRMCVLLVLRNTDQLPSKRQLAEYKKDSKYLTSKALRSENTCIYYVRISLIISESKKIFLVDFVAYIY